MIPTMSMINPGVKGGVQPMLSTVQVEMWTKTSMGMTLRN